MAELRLRNCILYYANVFFCALVFFVSFGFSDVESTEIRYKAGPRLRDLASWPPLAAGPGGALKFPKMSNMLRAECQKNVLSKPCPFT